MDREIKCMSTSASQRPFSSPAPGASHARPLQSTSAHDEICIPQIHASSCTISHPQRNCSPRSPKPSTTMVNRPRFRQSRAFCSTVMILLCFMACCQLSTAQGVATLFNVEERQLSEDVQELDSPIANRMVSDVLVDTSSPSKPRIFPRHRREEQGRRGVEESNDADSKAANNTMPTSTTSSTSTTASATTTLTASTFPEPFDAGLDNNFTTAGCPTFFSTFLNDPAFISCHPVSLLLQDTKSFNLTDEVLDTSCSVSSTCSALMSSYATQLLLSSNCYADYTLGNPVVQEAYNGFIAYDPVFNATCLKDGTQNNNYCFANAVTNTSSPTSSYVYYLPVGVALPAGSTPTCNHCLKMTMQIFAGYATNGTQPISKTYGAAAQEINLVCGPGFVNAAVTVTTSAGVETAGHAWASWIFLASMAVSLMMLL